MVQFHFKVSKCDQFGSGSDVVVDRTNTPLYPVSALLQYIEKRGDQPGAFFLDSSHSVIAKHFIARIREIVTSIGLPQHNFAGHSSRIGAATTAASLGIDDSTIQTLGRWHGATFLQYTERVTSGNIVHPGWQQRIKQLKRF